LESLRSCLHSSIPWSGMLSVKGFAELGGEYDMVAAARIEQ
jgi:hypothetical protein